MVTKNKTPVCYCAYIMNEQQQLISRGASNFHWGL